VPVVPHTRAQLTLAKATDNSSAAARCQGWPGPYALFIPLPRLKTASSAADQSQQRDGVLQPVPSEGADWTGGRNLVRSTLSFFNLAIDPLEDLLDSVMAQRAAHTT
jgi:hypothetical protein